MLLSYIAPKCVFISYINVNEKNNGIYFIS